MHFKVISFFSLQLLASISCAAFAPHPFATLSYGLGSADVSMRKNITILAPFQNTYVGDHRDHRPVAGIVAGAEFPLCSVLDMQFGASFYAASAYDATGVVQQFMDPSFNGLNYHFNISSRRVYIESKILYTDGNQWHPNVTFAAGRAFNKAYAYREEASTPTFFPTPFNFGNRSSHNFSYMAGLGLDYDLTPVWRLGVSYRFVDLGKIYLRPSAQQESSDVPGINHLHLNEFLLQLTYRA